MGMPTDLTIRAAADADGTLLGWGHLRLSGTLEQNGQVIADGLGAPRALDLSSFAQIVNSIDNDLDGANGWYAQRQGRLILPITGDNSPDSPLIHQVTFGESIDDPSLDLVNSARFGFDPALDDTTPISISLLAADSEMVPGAPDDLNFVSVYGTNFSSLPTRAIRLILRYDAVGVGDSELRLLAWSNEGWKALSDSDLRVDGMQHLITASTDPADFYAVAIEGSVAIPVFAAAIDPVRFTTPAVPEPATTGLLALGAAALMARRRRH